MTTVWTTGLSDRSTAGPTTDDSTETASSPRPGSRRSLDPAPAASLAQLVRIELRKAVDTRAGRWLLIVLCVVVVLACGALAIWGGEGERTVTSYLGLSVMPMAILLPVLGIMSATQEWSQRTGLTTFTLEPRRGRVVTAKVVAAALLGLIVIAVVFATSTLLALTTGGELNFGAISVPGVILMLTIFVLQGVAFGLALLNTPLAIVGALVLPTVWTILSSAFPTVAKAAVWLDLNQVTGPLVDGKMNGADWAHLATGVGFWVVLPLAIGTWRVLTREVK